MKLLGLTFNFQFCFAMRTYIFLFLSIISAFETSFSDGLTDANNLEDYNFFEYPTTQPDLFHFDDYPTTQSDLFHFVEYPTTQSDLFQDPFLFENENDAPPFEDQVPLNTNSLDSPWDIFADTSDDCSDVLLNKTRLKRRQGTFCAAKKKTRKSKLEIPTLQEIEAQVAATAADGSNQSQCPPEAHPSAIEAVCSSGDLNDEGNSAVYEGAFVLANCERRMSPFLLFPVLVPLSLVLLRFGVIYSVFTHLINEKPNLLINVYQ